jgi:hypothetical protein
MPRRGDCRLGVAALPAPCLEVSRCGVARFPSRAFWSAKGVGQHRCRCPHLGCGECGQWGWGDADCGVVRFAVELVALVCHAGDDHTNDDKCNGFDHAGDDDPSWRWCRRWGGFGCRRGCGRAARRQRAHGCEAADDLYDEAEAAADDHEAPADDHEAPARVRLLPELFRGPRGWKGPDPAWRSRLWPSPRPRRRRRRLRRGLSTKA